METVMLALPAAMLEMFAVEMCMALTLTFWMDQGEI